MLEAAAQDLEGTGVSVVAAVDGDGSSVGTAGGGAGLVGSAGAAGAGQVGGAADGDVVQGAAAAPAVETLSMEQMANECSNIAQSTSIRMEDIPVYCIPIIE